MMEKGEVASILHNLWWRIMKIVHSDNGFEFKFGPMLWFYSQKGILHPTSCVDVPQQNSMVEQKP